MKEEKNNSGKIQKKNIVIIILAILLIGSMVMGTIAYLNKIDSISNIFTVGSIEVPTTDPSGNPKDLTGNLYEPSWSENEVHKLVPGKVFAKDPYVGIGKGSEDSVVYVYVENDFSNKVYFTLSEGWEAVEGETKAGYVENTYTSGLFKYTAGLNGATTSDKWTTSPVFNQIKVSEDSNLEDFTISENKEGIIKVSSFIHQEKNDENELIDEATILNTVKEAFKINN